jgi:hypothetical protein
MQTKKTEKIVDISTVPNLTLVFFYIYEFLFLSAKKMFP